MMLVLVMAFLAFLALLHDFLLARVKKGPPASCHCFRGGEGSKGQRAYPVHFWPYPWGRHPCVERLVGHSR